MSVGKHEQQQMGIEKLLLQLTHLVRLGSADGNVEVTEKYYRRSIGQALVCGTFPIQVISTTLNLSTVVNACKLCLLAKS